MKIAVKMIFNCLTLLLVVMVTQVVADTACSDPLGMESGKIKDSQITVTSMFSTADGKLARLNKDEGSWGAWCVDQSHGRNDVQYNESIKIDLLNVRKITKVATQGRKGMNGRGKEYTKTYMISYCNDNRSWTFYKHKGSKGHVFEGNKDTTTVVSHELNPPIYARYIRIHPGYYKTNQECLRLELYGCQLSGTVLARLGIVSYSMPQGQSIKNNKVHYKDTSYSGTERNGILIGGVGLLTDGKFGPVDSKEHMGRGWVGWNGSVAEPHGVNITFEFNTLRKFNNVTVTMNISPTRKNMPFNKSRIFFGATKEELSEAGYLEYMYCPKLKKENRPFYNLNITLPLCGKVGRFVRLQFYLKERWMLFGEISFNSANDNVIKLQNCNDVTCEDKNLPTTLHPTKESPCTDCGVTVYAGSPSDQTNIIIGLICLCVILAYVILTLLFHLRRKSKQLQSKQNVSLELNSRERDIERDLTARTDEIVDTNLPEIEQTEDSFENPSPYVISNLSYTPLTATDGDTINSSPIQSPRSSTQTEETERDLTAKTDEVVDTNLPETEQNEDSCEDPSSYVISDPSYMYTSLTARDDDTSDQYQRLLKDSNDQSSKSLTQPQQTWQNGDCEIVSPNVISDPPYTQLTSHRDDDIVNPYQELLKSSSNPSQVT